MSDKMFFLLLGNSKTKARKNKGERQTKKWNSTRGLFYSSTFGCTFTRGNSTTTGLVRQEFHGLFGQVTAESFVEFNQKCTDKHNKHYWRYQIHFRKTTKTTFRIVTGVVRLYLK